MLQKIFCFFVWAFLALFSCFAQNSKLVYFQPLKWILKLQQYSYYHNCYCYYFHYHWRHYYYYHHGSTEGLRIRGPWILCIFYSKNEWLFPIFSIIIETNRPKHDIKNFFKYIKIMILLAFFLLAPPTKPPAITMHSLSNEWPWMRDLEVAFTPIRLSTLFWLSIFFAYHRKNLHIPIRSERKEWRTLSSVLQASVSKFYKHWNNFFRPPASLMTII